jgi:hypothetical protein
MDNNDVAFTQFAGLGGVLGPLLSFFFGGGAEGATDSVTSTFYAIWQIYSVIAFIVSAFLLYGLVYAKIRYDEIEEQIHERLHEEERAYAHARTQGSKNQRWDDAVHHVESDNPNDWRLAIIEADIMLESLLSSLGYSGMTIGDKLKQASPNFFQTLEDAWQAHKVRNEIAHKGADFVLTKRIAKDTIERYRRVFEEFQII